MTKGLLFASVWAVAIATAVGAVACSSSTTTTVTGTDDGGTTPVDSGKKDSSTVKDSGSGTGDDAAAGDDGGGSTGDKACAAMTKSACQTCCIQGHSMGQKTFITAVHTCGCQAGAQYCQTACAATFCAATPKNPDQACANCLDGTLQLPDGGDGVCYNDFATACGNDPDCLALFGQGGCLDGCPAAKVAPGNLNIPRVSLAAESN